MNFARDHSSVPGRLSAYVEGDLSEPERERVERHVSECPDCRDELHSLRQMLGRMLQAPPPADNPAPLDIAEAVRARLRGGATD